MRNFLKLSIFPALFLTFSVGGCHPGATVSPEDYFPLIQVALEGGEIASRIGKNEAIKDKNFAGCVASDVLVSGFASAKTVLSGSFAGKVVIPGFSVDLSECMVLEHKDPKSSEEAASLIEAIAGVSLAVSTHYAGKLQAANCKKGTIALASVAFIQALIKPVADEIANPDGVFEVEGVEIDLASCK